MAVKKVETINNHADPDYIGHAMFVAEAQVWATLAQAAATQETGRA